MSQSVQKGVSGFPMVLPNPYKCDLASQRPHDNPLTWELQRAVLPLDVIDAYKGQISSRWLSRMALVLKS